MCKRRNSKETESSQGETLFGGVAAPLFDLRVAADSGAPLHQIRGRARKATELIVKEYQHGRRTRQSAADEAGTVMGTLASRPSTKTCYPPAVIVNRRFLDLDKTSRRRWEIQEGEQSCKDLREHFDTKLAKCSERTHVELQRDYALMLATQATLEDNFGKAFSEAKQAANLTWRNHPASWYFILLLLQKFLRELNQQEITDAISEFLRKPRKARWRRDDFILSPKLFGL